MVTTDKAKYITGTQVEHQSLLNRNKYWHPSHYLSDNIKKLKVVCTAQEARVVKQTRSAVKSCNIWLDSLDPQQQLLGGQPFQQATVTQPFKMASKKVTIFLNFHTVINC